MGGRRAVRRARHLHVAVQQLALESDEVDQRRRDVGSANLVGDPDAWLDPGSTEDQGHVENFTVEHPVLSPAVKLPSVVQPLAVVRRDREDRLVEEAGFAQSAEEAAQVLVLIAELGRVHAGELTQQATRSRCRRGPRASPPEEG